MVFDRNGWSSDGVRAGLRWVGRWDRCEEWNQVVARWLVLDERLEGSRREGGRGSKFLL
jgi:hypothetical protein